MVERHGKFLRFFLLLAFFFPIQGEIQFSFPSLSDPEVLDGAKELAASYETFTKPFTKYYGDAILFSSFLDFAIGNPFYTGFPGFYLGLGSGINFSNTRAMKNALSSSVDPSLIPSRLPAFTLGVQLGFIFSPWMGIRASLFPTISLRLPALSVTQDAEVSFQYGHTRVLLDIAMKKGGLFSPSFVFSPFLFYQKGAIGIEKSSIQLQNWDFTSSQGNSGVVQTFSYNVKTQNKWEYYGIGGEIRMFFSFLFFYPYIGYSFSLQRGKFSSSLEAEGSVTISIPSKSITESSTGFLKVETSSRAPGFSHRLFLGGEFSFLLFHIAGEVQFTLGVERLAGLSLSIGTHF